MPPDLEPDAKGAFAPVTLPAGQQHKLVLHVLRLDHRYHDEDPVQEATYTVRFANGLELTGTLDKTGRAVLAGVPTGPAEVRYGPDNRPFEPVPQEKNPDFREAMNDADVDALFEKYQTA